MSTRSRFPGKTRRHAAGNRFDIPGTFHYHTGILFRDAERDCLSLMEYLMRPPISSDVEGLSSSLTSESEAELLGEAEVGSHVATETLSADALLNTQDKLQAYMHERLRALETQLQVDQQRQRDRIDEELHKMRQQLATAAQEQRQQHQNMAAVVRETFEEMRKELAEALHRLSQESDHALRQSESHNRVALEKLRDEMLQHLLERDRTMVKRQILGDLLITLGKKLRAAAKDHDA